MCKIIRTSIGGNVVEQFEPVSFIKTNILKIQP